MRATPEEILKKYWGYDSFRELQREIIESVIAGNDTLALMPTGGGKSITFQISAMMLEGICIVVTPLISLMKDQVDALRRRQIMAQSVHAGMTAVEIDRVLDNCVYGDYKFLYVSPERLSTAIFRARMQKMTVALIAVDEAHCISQWGYDFRPSYLEIASVRDLAPEAPVLAVTATATPLIADDIMDKLQFTGKRSFKMSFARSNLSYLVRRVEDKMLHTQKILDNIPGTGIMYCRTRSMCEEMAEELTKRGYSADYYHGGLSYQMRSSKQEAWLKGATRLIVATNAFGMGIDKPDVRFVIHNQMPDNLESYYQEAGRAGRDGKPSYAVMLFSSKDRGSVAKSVDSEFPSLEQIRYVYNCLFDYYSIAIGDGKTAAFDFDVFDFCNKFKLFSVTVLSCIKILQICNYMTLTEEIDSPTRIKFTVGREELYRLQIKRSDLERFITIIMRLYTGVFSDFIAIDEDYIAAQSGYTKEYIGESFKQLGMLRVLKYIPRRRSPLLVFNEERLPIGNLRISPESYAIRKKIAEERLEKVFELVERVDKCRERMLREYFGETIPLGDKYDCGKCDVCRSRKKNTVAGADVQDTLESKVLDFITQNTPVQMKSIISEVRGEHESIIQAIRNLLQEGAIIQNSDNTISVKPTVQK